MLLVWPVLHEKTPTIIQPGISLLGGDLLPFEPEIPVQCDKESVEESGYCIRSVEEINRVLNVAQFGCWREFPIWR